jgi:hypothetical protein
MWWTERLPKDLSGPLPPRRWLLTAIGQAGPQMLASPLLRSRSGLDGGVVVKSQSSTVVGLLALDGSGDSDARARSPDSQESDEDFDMWVNPMAESPNPPASPRGRLLSAATAVKEKFTVSSDDAEEESHGGLTDPGLAPGVAEVGPESAAALGGLDHADDCNPVVPSPPPTIPVPALERPVQTLAAVGQKPAADAGKAHRRRRRDGRLRRPAPGPPHSGAGPDNGHRRRSRPAWGTATAATPAATRTRDRISASHSQGTRGSRAGGRSRSRSRSRGGGGGGGKSRVGGPRRVDDDRVAAGLPASPTAVSAALVRLLRRPLLPLGSSPPGRSLASLAAVAGTSDRGAVSALASWLVGAAALRGLLVAVRGPLQAAGSAHHANSSLSVQLRADGKAVCVSALRRSGGGGGDDGGAEVVCRNPYRSVRFRRAIVSHSGDHVAVGQTVIPIQRDDGAAREGTARRGAVGGGRRPLRRSAGALRHPRLVGTKAVSADELLSGMRLLCVDPGSGPVAAEG